ncbi:hypothetical protein [Lyngbya aestuarii]|uniref:hypothetical protein n=1 Tax=Lyngbya aestuarii TaxID=118322 RepID=UPI00403DF11D
MNKNLIGLALFLTLAVTLGACNEAGTDPATESTEGESPAPTVSPADAPSPSPS